MNNMIRVPEIRCIDEDGEALGVIRTRDALVRAHEAGLDLVEINATSKPPVCRIMDHGKFKYDQDKKKKEQKKRQIIVKLKEVKFHVNVGDHDYETKLRHAQEFLAEGHRVKLSLMFRGRENAHRELGFELMKRIVADLAEVAVVEQAPRLQGRNIFMLVVPKKNKK
ncbi:MAG: translation initiation factor IF-3 [Kiritimatiellales bacterium]|nr:translation initiation factor IF-3 [Kiritimatiellota bacterium]MBL7011930.1 translation initiation factor IF-3 [Kiritimatiellales bacterium]